VPDSRRSAGGTGKTPDRETDTMQAEGYGSVTIAAELDPDCRVHRLREMYWQRTHLRGRVRRPLSGCGEETARGHARDFAALLAGSDPFIQDHELVVGCSLAVPREKESLDLGHYNAHYPPGYHRLVPAGFTGLRDEARRRLREESDPDKRDFLEGVAISYEAACDYAARYASHALEMAREEGDPGRRLELEQISRTCQELATGPPSSFRAALQLVQFVRLFGGGGCIGRFDQWMYPFFRKDIDTGTLTRESAQELLECFFVKLNYFGVKPVQPNDTLRNIALAGQTAGGEDASNALTYMCLEASVKLRLPEPKLNVRFFRGSDPELLEACCRVTATGVNTLAVFNDEVAVPALQRLGISLHEARDYCNDGCSELILGGRSTIQFSVHDALPPLTETVQKGLDTPFESFDGVLAHYKSRLGRYMPAKVTENPPVTFPFFAATLDDCLQTASSRGVRYSLQGSILAQTGDAADGLAAIKKLVFEEGSLVWPELAAAVEADFEGYEPLRQMIRNRSPKYGNDQDEVDDIAVEIAEHFCDGVHARVQNAEGPGCKLAAGLMCFGIQRKAETPASPDGRRKGDLTANSFSPAVGMDRSGPTAVIRSAAKADLTRASHGSVLDIALHSSAGKGETAYEKLKALVRSFLEIGCTATLQMNLIDRETLLRAREQPDSPEFRTLIVRVWGFSAVFVELSDSLQDHVLGRTQHEV